jgi:hypothetical protein
MGSSTAATATDVAPSEVGPSAPFASSWASWAIEIPESYLATRHHLTDELRSRIEAIESITDATVSSRR